MPAIAFQPDPLVILSALVWLVVSGWIVTILLTLYGLSRQKPLLPANNLHLLESDAPLVSVLVPARNEEHRVLSECIRSILAQDYGSFEVIAINDRSTDATATILEAFAKRDARIRAIEGAEPPAGWLGKPYAIVLVLALAGRRSGVSPAYGLTAPLGLGVLYAMLFDSSIRIATGKGVSWKGRRVYERTGVRPPRIS